MLKALIGALVLVFSMPAISAERLTDRQLAQVAAGGNVVASNVNSTRQVMTAAGFQLKHLRQFVFANGS